MSIIQNFVPFLIPFFAITITQSLIYMNLAKKLQWKIVVLGNLMLLGVGVLFSVVGLIVAQGEPGSWAGLGFIILLIMTIITTIISSGISVIMYVLLQSKMKS